MHAALIISAATPASEMEFAFPFSGNGLRQRQRFFADLHDAQRDFRCALRCALDRFRSFYFFVFRSLRQVQRTHDGVEGCSVVIDEFHKRRLKGSCLLQYLFHLRLHGEIFFFTDCQAAHHCCECCAKRAGQRCDAPSSGRWSAGCNVSDKFVNPFFCQHFRFLSRFMSRAKPFV